MLNFTSHIYRLIILKPITTYKINLLVLICFILFSGCKSSKNIFVNQSEIKSSSKIIFLNYSIEKGLNQNRTIQFINKKVVDGKLKKNTSQQSIENGIQGDLICVQLNKKFQVLHQILIKNPLVRSVEYIDESNNLQTKIIKPDKTQFSIRLQLKSNTKYITISNFAKNKPLIKTQIN